MSKQAAVFMVLMALGISTGRVHAIVVDEWGPLNQPDGTTFTAHSVGDEVAGSMFTGDGYAFVYNHSDGYYYYAELDAQGEYRASAAKVGIDDPATYGIPKNLQRSAARKAEIQAERIAYGFIGDPNNQASGASHTPSDYYSCIATNLGSPPDYEAPADADTDNVYAVSVIASNGTLADTLDVTVTVSNVEEAGMVALDQTHPQVGPSAVVATLSDPAGKLRKRLGRGSVGRPRTTETSGRLYQ